MLNLPNGLSRLVEAWRRARAEFYFRTLSRGPLRDLNRFEFKVYSQNGEDGILHALFRRIGIHNRFCVEFGTGDGSERNTRWLEANGWSSLLMDPGEHNPAQIKRELVTAENINALFDKYRVPTEFDLLSIDIDGNDFWVWKALDSTYAPHVVVVEYNAKIPPGESKTIAYQPEFLWDGTDYFGASLGAWVKLARTKGYALVACDSHGINAFFVRNDLFARHFEPTAIEKLYRPARYGAPADRGWPASSRQMIDV